MKSLAVVFIGGFLLLIFFGCQSPNDGNTNSKTVTVRGQVIDQINGNPIDSAVVQILDISPTQTILADSQGFYSSEFNVDNTIEIRITAFKETFFSDTTTALAVPGRTIEIPLLKLLPTTANTTASGNAASIILDSQSALAIGVKESGSLESVQLIFEVQDSTGKAIDLTHSVKVNFTFGAAPGGGEFIHPASVFTNGNGKAETYIFSGVKAGVVQIIAEITIDSTIIRSIPVVISIHGGLPDANHFSLAVEKVNFPGYNIFGLTNIMTAFVGDKYGNPVRPNTAVYFTTDGGIVEGSAQTNELGSASAQLISAAPKPFHVTLGAGFATVVANTADENQNDIFANAIVLFSGFPTIFITPSSFNISNGGSQNFVYTVSDQNDNPLAGGTVINVTVEGENIKALGALTINIPDTQSPSWTNFSFTVADNDTSDILTPVVIKVSSVGPNGSALLTIGGTSH